MFASEQSVFSASFRPGTSTLPLLFCLNSSYDLFIIRIVSDILPWLYFFQLAEFLFLTLSILPLILTPIAHEQISPTDSDKRANKDDWFSLITSVRRGLLALLKYSSNGILLGRSARNGTLKRPQDFSAPSQGNSLLKAIQTIVCSSRFFFCLLQHA